MTNPDPQAIWNLAIKTAANACQNVMNLNIELGKSKIADKCRTNIMRYYNDEYHLKKLMGTEPPEDKGPI